MIALTAVSTLAVVWLLWRGREYYLTPLQERPEHPDYGNLRPAGFMGHGLGILGSAMMLLLLAYSLRKRWRPLRNAGPIRHWLSVHIYLGVFGPLLVVLHSSFKVGGLVALSFWSMVAVALSGVLGRYLYHQIPRNLQGEAQGLEALEQANAALGRELRSEFGFGEAAIEGLRELAAGPALSSGGLLRAIAQSLWSDLTLRPRLRAWLRDGAGGRALPGGQRRRILKLARRKALAERRVLLLARIERIFHHWHVIHKPFAIIMVLIMIVHVGVALLFGYRWIG